jgi:homoserine kinase
VISGAGPTVLVLARSQDEAKAVVEQAPEGWAGLVLPVDASGAQVLS